MIEFRDVTVCYEPHRRYPTNALEGLNLKIGAGEWVFLVGPSGAGKSTVLKLVYAGIQALQGQITVDGRDVTRLPQREIPFLRRKIGVIFQDFQLLAQKTAWENVAFALQVIGTPQSRLVREVPRALETVGLTHRAHAQPHELSGGEQQRIAIARAIVNHPLILLADEPTGNLDPQTAWEIAQVIQRVNEEYGTTVLMATHDRAIVDAMRQRVVRLADGRVSSDENPGVYHPEDDALAPTRSNFKPASSVAPYNGIERDDIETAGMENDDMDAAEAALPALDGEKVRHPVDIVPGVAPKADPAVESYLEKVRKNEAPLGSSENPIVQFGNAAESDH